MRRALALLGAVTAVLAITVSGASGINRPQTFSLLEIDQSDASTDLGFEFESGPKPGDRFAFKSSLYKWAGVKRGARIGFDKGTCTFIQVPATLQQNSTIWGNCTAGFFLPGGQIVGAAFIRFTDGPLNVDVPIIGGTGIYANARGYVHVRDLGSGDSGHSNLTFHLLP
jgi:hypothetical protein